MEDVDPARKLLSEHAEELALFDALGESADWKTRKLAARILAQTISETDVLVFEASLQHNMADSFADGVREKILGARFYPVTLTRTVSSTPSRSLLDDRLIAA